MKRALLITTCMLIATTASAQNVGMQSPAYTECTSLASSNPARALEKADAWLLVDAGIAAHHCRAMALFGLGRYSESGDLLATVRGMVPLENIGLRSYVAGQAARAYAGANASDRALNILNSQIGEISTVRGDNASNANLTADLLLERAKISNASNKLEEAAKDLDHAVSLSPINEDVLLTRADVFEKLGDRGLAINDVQAVLKINKDNKLAKETLARLNGTATAATAQPVPSATSAAEAEPAAPAAKPATKKKETKPAAKPAKKAEAPKAEPAPEAP